MARIKPSLTYANVVSTLALFLVLIGTGVAATISALDSGEKKQVRNIARKVANQRINTLGPNLSVANAANAANATNATNAVNAQNATQANLAMELQFVGKAVWNSGATEGLDQIAAHECIDTPPVEADAGPGDQVLGTVNGGDADNPLPAGLTATFLREDGDVTLRLCNPTDAAVPQPCPGSFPCFSVEWQFVVLRRTDVP
jgi:hypothetical protein